jgi:hypothetical protein
MIDVQGAGRAAIRSQGAEHSFYLAGTMPLRLAPWAVTVNKRR